jgi:hypothetical protein
MYRMKNSGFLSTIAFLAITSGTLAAQTTTSFNLVGVEGAAMGGVYTSPYYATVGSSSSQIAVICDDFYDNSFVPESWTAYVTSLSSLPSSPPTPQYTSGTVGSTTLTQTQAYTVAAYLAVEILQQNQATPSGQEAAGDLSYAMWALFNPYVLTEQNGTTCSLPSGEGCLSLTDYNAAKTDLSNAFAAVQAAGLNPGNFDSAEGVSSVTIYSYDTGALCGGSPCATIPPQEFIAVNMAEPPSPALLAFDLLAVAGLMLLARRRLAGSVN